MYAVIETGGKQYRVEVGTELEVELLDVEPGETITLERVLLVADGDESTIGRPLVADASVSAEVVRQTRGPKLISFKYRPKARSRVKKGHRQELTVLRIADITLNGKSAAKAARQGRGRRQDRAPAPRRSRRGAGRQGRRARREARCRIRGGREEGEPGRRRRRRPRPTPRLRPTTEAKTTPSGCRKAEGRASRRRHEVTTTKDSTKAAAPKPTTAKADADAPSPRRTTPKRTRATKKDE